MFSLKKLFTVCRNSFPALLTAGLIAATSPAIASSATSAQQTVMVYGDSLVAGYGLEAGQGFPEQLQAALAAAQTGSSGENAEGVTRSQSHDCRAAMLGEVKAGQDSPGPLGLSLRKSTSLADLINGNIGIPSA